MRCGCGEGAGAGAPPPVGPVGIFLISAKPCVVVRGDCMNQYRQQIEETIATITNQFRRKPHNFFNEHEFHQYCYHVFYSKKEFSKQYSTLDGKKTNILKPEYPSIARFSRKRIEGDAKGNRAHYDMAILSPEFIQNNNYDTVVNRDIRHSSGKVSDLIAAMEFKYITKHLYYEFS